MRDPQLAERIDVATRSALLGIVDLCVEQAVDALLIAGDLYDGEQKSMHTAAYLATQLRRLREAGISVLVIQGNHDAQSQLSGELSLPDNTHVFSARGESKTLLDGRVVVHGVSFEDRHAPDSLLPKYNPPVPGAINIGMLHTSLNGAEGHDVYAPCSLSELTDFGYEYWALGHIHKRKVHSMQPAVVMPGNPQGRHINEDGPRSVSLVTIDATGTVSIDEHSVSQVQFERLCISVTGQDNWSRLLDQIEQALRAVRQTGTVDELILRLDLTGVTTLCHLLHRDLDLLLITVREMAVAIGHVGIEKISLQGVSHPQSQADVPGENDALMQLASLVNSQVLESVEVRLAGEQELIKLRGKLPADIRSVLGDNEAEQRAILEQLLGEGGDWMLAQLQGDS